MTKFRGCKNGTFILSKNPFKSDKKRHIFAGCKLAWSACATLRYADYYTDPAKDPSVPWAPKYTIRVKDNEIFLHMRFIWLLKFGDPPKVELNNVLKEEDIFKDFQNTYLS